MNLPAGGDWISSAPGNFDPEDPLTFNHSTSVTIFDSLGDSHIMTYYFIKDNPSTNANQWMMFAGVDGIPVDLADPGGQTDPNPTEPPGTPILNPQGGGNSGPLSAGGGVTGMRMYFDSSGDFVAQLPMPGDGGAVTVPLGATILSNGADPTQTVKINFNLDPLGPNPNEPTQFASNFEVTSLEQDGLAVGRLTGIDIGSDGLIRATYSNGTSEPLSRIALVNFANEQGLTQIGNTSWKESISSGEALAGEAGSGTFGTINSSALEQSNVNLTTELIDLISAQRNFQANSRALEVDNQLNQTILQIR
jgi:flagellar hook protein FlgE